MKKNQESRKEKGQIQNYFVKTKKLWKLKKKTKAHKKTEITFLYKKNWIKMKKKRIG